MNPLVVGILALQGGFAKHAEMLQALGVHAVEVRKPADLLPCDALVIPGGESTTMMKQVKFIDFAEALRSFAAKKPVFGTCAGVILMSHTIVGSPMQPFQLLDIDVQRNAFGRQTESFRTSIDIFLKAGHPEEVPAIFIRAPRIVRTGEKVQVLASFKGEPVLVRQGKHLGATFHPELSSNATIHRYFLDMVSKE